MNKSESISNLSAALTAFQAEMPAVAFDATNPFLKNKYATLGAIIEASRPILAKHGLAVLQPTVTEGELIGVETILLHKSGEFISSVATMETGEEKGKSSAQVAGSVITYLRRYSLAAILGIYSDEDNDGNKPSGRAPLPRPAKAAEPELEAVEPDDEDAPLTIEEAVKVETSQGKAYGSMAVIGLERMLSAMYKRLKTNHLEPEDKALLEYKIRAAQVVLAAKQSESIL